MVAAATGSGSEAIVAKGRKRNRPREIAIFLSQRFCQMPCAELGHYFGGGSDAAISLCSKRLANKVVDDPVLREVVEGIERRIIDSWDVTPT